MLYDTLNQFSFFLILALLGFSCGFLFDLKKIIKNKTISNVFDFIFVVLCFTCLYIVNLKQHYGLFRMFPIVVFFVFLILQRFLSKKILAKFFQKCYNLIKKKHETKK